MPRDQQRRVWEGWDPQEVLGVPGFPLHGKNDTATRLWTILQVTRLERA